MKKITLLTSIIIFTISYSCVKDLKYLLPESSNTIPLNHPFPEIIWQHSLDVDQALITQSIDPILFNDFIISSYSPQYSNSERIAAFSKENGERIWEWNDFINSFGHFNGDEKLYVHEDILLACSSQDDYAIDLNTGQTIWSNMIEQGSNNMSHFNELLFHTDKSGSSWQSDSSRILMSNIENGQWSEVITMYKENGYEVRIDAPAVYIDLFSDTFLLFQVQHYNNPTGNQKVDIYCYNMTQNSIVWSKLNYKSDGFTNHHIPIIDEDRVYISTREEIHCIDIINGDFIWTYPLFSNGSLEEYQLHNNLFITFLGNGDLLALNKFSGNEVYVNEGLSHSPSNFSIYEDRLYFSDNYIYILKVNTGEVLYTFQSPNGIYQFTNSIAVDLENNRMYTSDKKDLFCLQLPE
jgi:outer membrane protein assembly factor BamB